MKSGVAEARCFEFGGPARCPHCGTRRLRRLAAPDRIDRLRRGPLGLALRLAGAALYHCRFCRLQFYDWRGLAAPGGQTANGSH